nr:MAG TPA: hypothetical protein [Microviridae sp.]
MVVFTLVVAILGNNEQFLQPFELCYLFFLPYICIVNQ